MFNRRSFLIGASALGLSGCASTGNSVDLALDAYYVDMYSAKTEGEFTVPAVDIHRIDNQWWRQRVPYSSPYAPGTIVVDTPGHHLYLVEADGMALRYGVGVGREEALQFRGNAVIGRKAEWPGWTPTANMIRREPDRYGPYAGGLPGGPMSPLGARALYLYRNGKDTHFRLHGTIEPYTIGTNVSSGCIRLMDQDIIDLYSRVPSGTRVIVA